MCSHRHLRLAVPCSHPPCTPLVGQFLQTPLPHANGRDSLPRWALKMPQLPQKALEAAPTAGGLLRLSCIPLGYRGCPHPDGGGRTSTLTLARELFAERLLRFNPGQRLSTTRPLARSPAGGLAGENGKGKREKTRGFRSRELKKEKRNGRGKKPTDKKEWGKESPRKPRDAKESNCSPPTDRWPASPRARAAPAILHPPVLLLSTASCAVGYPFGELGADVPAVSPPSALGTPSLLAGGAVGGAEKPLVLCKHCSALTRTPLASQGSFQHRRKT